MKKEEEVRVTGGCRYHTASRRSAPQPTRSSYERTQRPRCRAMSQCRRRICPDCEMPLIHRANRQRDESSSSLGQHVSERLARGGWSYVDIDGAGLRGKCVRIFEHKWDHSAEMGEGQKNTLRRLAKLIELGISRGLLSPDSGVFKIRSKLDWSDDTNFTSGAEVTRMAATQDGDISGHLHVSQLNDLLETRPFSFTALQEALI